MIVGSGGWDGMPESRRGQDESGLTVSPFITQDIQLTFFNLLSLGCQPLSSLPSTESEARSTGNTSHCHPNHRPDDDSSAVDVRADATPRPLTVSRIRSWFGRHLCPNSSTASQGDGVCRRQMCRGLRTKRQTRLSTPGSRMTRRTKERGCRDLVMQSLLLFFMPAGIRATDSILSVVPSLPAFTWNPGLCPCSRD